MINTNKQLERFEFAFGRSGAGPRAVLGKVPGLTLKGADRGQLKVGAASADVRVEAGNALRVEMPRPPAGSAAEMLRLSETLPGNARIAIASRGTYVVADTQMDGELHLSKTFAEFREAMRRGAGKNKHEAGALKPPAASPAINLEAVQRAVDDMNWPDDAVVHDEDQQQWELRPRLAGGVVPVGLSVCDGALQLQRTVLSTLSDEHVDEAIGDQALRFNSQLRHARLVLTGDDLIAEARLHDGQVAASWLATAARAVANAYQHTRLNLLVLAEQEEVRSLYASMLVSPFVSPALEQKKSKS